MDPCTQELRLENLETAQVALARDVGRICKVVGRSPDIATGDPGEGMARTLTEIHSWMLAEKAAAKRPASILRHLAIVVPLLAAILSGGCWLSAHVRVVP